MTLLELIRAAIKEDLPRGDVTTESLAVKPQQGRAKLKAKEDIILSGAPAFELTIQFLEPNSKIKWHFEESQSILKGQNICTIEGDMVQILKAERVALNFLGHLSGVATYTHRFVRKLEGTSTKILDTRKTTPMFRELEKKAVIHGGGENHRLNLSTAILIKDNHIALMGGISAAIRRIQQHSQLPIEVEASTIEDVKEAIALNVDRILLDNMSNEQIKAAVALIPPPIKIEASGNMTLDRVRSVAELGVHYISVGAVTHSAPVADVSLEFEWN